MATIHFVLRLQLATSYIANDSSEAANPNNNPFCRGDLNSVEFAPVSIQSSKSDPCTGVVPKPTATHRPTESPLNFAAEIERRTSIPSAANDLQFE